MTEDEKNAMEAAFTRWLRRSRDFTDGDKSLSRAAWRSAWLECRRYLERVGGPG
jgi:hypothetical protein